MNNMTPKLRGSGKVHVLLNEVINRSGLRWLDFLWMVRLRHRRFHVAREIHEILAFLPVIRVDIYLIRFQKMMKMFVVCEQERYFNWVTHGSTLTLSPTDFLWS